MSLKSVNKDLKPLTIVGFIEGISFLVLIFIAMPLKYIMGLAGIVSWVGLIHGVLFLIYIAALITVIYRLKLSLWSFILGFIAAILPFGPFIFDRRLKRLLQ